MTLGNGGEVLSHLFKFANWDQLKNLNPIGVMHKDHDKDPTLPPLPKMNLQEQPDKMWYVYLMEF